MRRGLLVGGVIALAVISAIAWLSVRYVTEENRAHDLTVDLRGLQSRQRELNLAKQSSEQRLRARIDDLRRSLERERKDLAHERSHGNELARRLRPLRALASSFVPRGARVEEVRTIPAAGGGNLLVARWLRRPDGYPAFPGVAVWRSTGGDAVSPQGWELSYKATIGGFGASGDPMMTFGPRGGQRTYEWPAEYLSFDVGDATGDGTPDIALIESNSGTGGCRSTRVLANEVGQLRQVFHRDTCEGGVYIGDGVLRVKLPLYPKGCDYTHGCGMRLAVLRWNGVSWDRVRGRVLYRSAWPRPVAPATPSPRRRRSGRAA